MDKPLAGNLIGLLLSALCLFSSQASADINLKFGVYTSDKPSSMVRQFRPVLDRIEKGLSQRLVESVKIKMQVAKNYEEGISDLATGRVDIARFGPVSHILAKRRNPALSILAAESNDGEKTYNGVICVHPESGLEDIATLKCKRFAFGDENSTTG